jgi:hypothetical protein
VCSAKQRYLIALAGLCLVSWLTASLAVSELTSYRRPGGVGKTKIVAAAIMNGGPYIAAALLVPRRLPYSPSQAQTIFQSVYILSVPVWWAVLMLPLTGLRADTAPRRRCILASMQTVLVVLHLALGGFIVWAYFEIA